MSVNHQYEESIFNAARLIVDQDQREAYLLEACVDEAVRTRVIELLMVYDNEQDLLEAAGPSLFPLILGDVPAQETEWLGRMIGPYTLREVLGEGGMGIVYVAEQEKPIRRKVALKVVKPGMNSKEVVARFESERQALALMDHPNIAKVHDAGTTDAGLPYFVMELVRGLPITEYCDQRRLPPHERLKLFITVCQAVQHAHQRGIIHRDLKPSNVMITLHDGVPVPKVIDFGVAKALNHRLTEHTLYTSNAQMVGTPLYMSPEQAELSGFDVDMRSDVYSLGVLLYELLTGTTPFEKDTFSKLGYDEMRRMIREEEPPRPSRRISTFGAHALSTVAHCRRFDERQLSKSLHGELDWIVMKALEKDRTRRYGSADALAADLQRHLDDKPVEACPPSMVYRFRKLVRRKRATLAIVVPALFFTICGPLVGYALYRLGHNDDVVERNASQQVSRAPGMKLPGLVPEPLFTPEVGRWQLIAKMPQFIGSAKWSPDETQFAFVDGYHVRIYSASPPRLQHVLVGHTRPVTAIAWHPDGTRLASASVDGTVRVWSSAGVPLQLLSGHDGVVSQIAWRPDGTCLASASYDGTIRFWTSEGDILGIIDERGKPIICMDWSPDGKLFAVGGALSRRAPVNEQPDGGFVHLWDAEKRVYLREFGGTAQAIPECVDWRPDGKQLAVGDQTRICLWNLDGTVGSELILGVEVGTLAWHPDGRRIAFFSGRIGPVHIWETGEKSATVMENLNLSNAKFISWSRDGSRFLVSDDLSIREWDARSGLTPLVQKMSFDRPAYVRWSPDGTTIAADNTFYNVDGIPVAQPEIPAGGKPAWWAADIFTRRSDGWTADITDRGKAAIRDDQGRFVTTLKHGREINSVAWSPDGKWLATGGEFAVRLWAPDGTPGPVMETPFREEVLRLAWSPDGRWIASAQFAWRAEGTTRLWRPDGTPGPVFHDHPGGTAFLAWSADSRRLVSQGLRDNTLAACNVETGEAEWQILRLDNDRPVTLRRSGQPAYGDRELLDGSFLYLIEKPDGTNGLMAFSEFRKRYARSFVAAYREQCTKFAGKSNWQQADAALADAVTFQADGDLAVQRKIVEAARAHCKTLNEKGEHSRALSAIRTAVDLQQKITEQRPDDLEEEVTRGDCLHEWGNVLRNVGQAAESLPVVNQAVETFRNLILKLPEHEKICSKLCRTYMARAEVHRALAQFNEALADLDEAVRVSSDSSLVLDDCGVVFVTWKEYDKAIATFSEAIAKGLSHNAIAFHPWYHLALVQLTARDFEGYRHTCQQMLARLAETTSADASHFIAWTCALHPGAVDDYELPIRLAQQAIDVSPNQAQFISTLGSLQYRAGRFHEALARLKTAHDLAGETSTDGASSRAYTWYFLSLVEHRLGHAAEAAEWLQRADQWTNRVLTDLQNPVPWNRRLTLELLRREAHSLMDRQSMD